jgi:demethylmenaquinone methyltransferase/2-methoxy-6-polyprenyl-1,4-benzoquinol methylase
MTDATPDPVDSMLAAAGDAKARQVNAMFGRIAGRYDAMNTMMTGGLHHVWRARATRIATERNPGLVLDVATGTGDFAFQLARRPGVDRVVGLDFVAPMISLAHDKQDRRSALGSRLRFLVGDALRLPFADDTFGAATVGWGVRNFGDLDAGLRELVRVLRPGGRLVILEMTPAQGKTIGKAVRLYSERVVPIIGALAARDRSAYTYLPQSARAFPPAAALVARMGDAGLSDVHYRLAGLGSVAIHWGDKPA